MPFLSGPDNLSLWMFQPLKLPVIATLPAWGAENVNKTPPLVISGPGCFGPQDVISMHKNTIDSMARRDLMIVVYLP
jgi:hypothetical protein